MPILQGKQQNWAFQLQQYHLVQSNNRHSLFHKTAHACQRAGHALHYFCLPADSLPHSPQARLQQFGGRLGINALHHHIHRRRAASVHGHHRPVPCQELYRDQAAPPFHRPRGRLTLRFPSLLYRYIEAVLLLRGQLPLSSNFFFSA